jgi:hypothetical protein
MTLTAGTPRFATNTFRISLSILALDLSFLFNRLVVETAKRFYIIILFSFSIYFKKRRHPVSGRAMSGLAISGV